MQEDYKETQTNPAYFLPTVTFREGVVESDSQQGISKPSSYLETICIKLA